MRKNIECYWQPGNQHNNKSVVIICKSVSKESIIKFIFWVGNSKTRFLVQHFCDTEYWHMIVFICWTVIDVKNVSVIDVPFKYPKTNKLEYRIIRSKSIVMKRIWIYDFKYFKTWITSECHISKTLYSLSSYNALKLTN